MLSVLVLKILRMNNITTLKGRRRKLSNFEKQYVDYRILSLKTKRTVNKYCTVVSNFFLITDMGQQF